MKPITPEERRLAETAARLIAKAEEIGLPDPPNQLGVPDSGLRLLARAHLELCDQVRRIHDRVDLTDPNDPIGVALTEVALATRPSGLTLVREHVGEPLTVPPGGVFTNDEDTARALDESAGDDSPAVNVNLSDELLLDLYCRTMHESRERFVEHQTYVVRVWDGMDGCWTDCVSGIGREEALRIWAARTDGGRRCVSYDEIDYYRIFPDGTRMHWDGSEGREMHR